MRCVFVASIEISCAVTWSVEKIRLDLLGLSCECLLNVKWMRADNPRNWIYRTLVRVLFTCISYFLKLYMYSKRQSIWWKYNLETIKNNNKIFHVYIFYKKRWRGAILKTVIEENIICCKLEHCKNIKKRQHLFSTWPPISRKKLYYWQTWILLLS